MGQLHRPLMSSDNAALLKALEQWIETTSARHPSEADVREALRLVSRAKMGAQGFGRTRR
jgi:uncharacterized protein YaeQ